MRVKYRKLMDKLIIACISEEIGQENIAGNNIRLIKFLKYLPANFKFHLFTVKRQSVFNFSAFQNVNLHTVDSSLYNKTKTFFQKRNYFKKVIWYFINYYSTIDYFWAFKACNKIITTKENYDIIFLQIPSLLNIIYGWYLKKRTNLPLIFDLRDDLICYKERLFISFLEKMMVKKADLINCTTKASLKNLSTKYPNYINKLVYLPNGVDLNELKEISQNRGKTYFDSTKINIVYAGSMSASRLQFFKKITASINNLINQSRVNQNDFKFHFFPGCEKNFNFSWTSHHHNISNKEQYYKMLNDADILLSVNYNTPFSIPGKLYEFLTLSQFVWHFDNSMVCNEVLTLFKDSNLYLETEMDKFQHDFIQLLENKKGFKLEKKKEDKYTAKFVQNFSRSEIANKFGTEMINLKKKGIPQHV